MANPNHSDPTSSMSAAELRRRLLASTPPPLAATASTPDTNSVSDADIGPGAWSNNSSQDLLARLRMPGSKSGPQQTPITRVAVQPQQGNHDNTALNGKAPQIRRGPARSQSGEAGSAIAGALNQLAGLGDMNSRASTDDSPLAEIQRLRGENKELRTLLEEMKHLLQEASDAEQLYATKEKEYLANMAAKDGQLEELGSHLEMIEEQIAKGELVPPPPIPKSRTELEEWGDDLEREGAKLTHERKKLEEERRQLREDEESLEKQMRDMEVSMARERAVIARQETELKRLSAEIQHELEILQRGDSALREQMTKFQRRAQEVLTKPANNGRR